MPNRCTSAARQGFTTSDLWMGNMTPTADEMHMNPRKSLRNCSDLCEGAIQTNPLHRTDSVLVGGCNLNGLPSPDSHFTPCVTPC